MSKMLLRLLLTLFTILCCTTISGASIQDSQAGVVFEETGGSGGSIGFFDEFIAPKTGASNAANGTKLKEHLRQQQKYGTPIELPDGRIRYKGDVTPASTPGEMAGRRRVREWDPNTGKKRAWQETVDHDGRVRQVRPDEKATGGSKKHYRFDANGNYIGSW